MYFEVCILSSLYFYFVERLYFKFFVFFILWSESAVERRYKLTLYCTIRFAKNDTDSSEQVAWDHETSLMAWISSKMLKFCLSGSL